ncbi:MAG: hypothetical protein ACREVG_18285 [Burkholderiales bacterium]
MSASKQDLIDKLHQLPPERIAEVEDFVDFLRIREEERSQVRTATALSEPAFAKVWDNPEDAAYDAV